MAVRHSTIRLIMRWISQEESLITFCRGVAMTHGSHMDNFCRVPYLNILFSEKSVMSVGSRFMDYLAKRSEEIRSGLNRMTLAKFERIIGRSGLTARTSDSYSRKNLPVVKHSLVLREFLLSTVICILVADATSGSVNA